jgi:hypothetical protein
MSISATTTLAAAALSPGIDERLHHRATALAQDVVEHDAELEVGVLLHLLDALDVSGALAHETACACA